MQKQEKLINVKLKAFYTPAGQPTCAIDWNKGKICIFLRTKNLGTQECCSATGLNIYREDTMQGRKMGYLVPCEGCLIHKSKK